MNKEEQVKHWYYKDLGWLGAYIVETNGECTKQVDVSHIKRYIEELLQEKQQLKEKANQLETNIDKAIEFIDQELQYHLSPFDYKQVDEDINTLIGILRGKE